MTPFLFKAAFCAYLASTLGYVTSILGKRVRIARASLWLMSAAFGFHSLFLLFRIFETGHIPILGYLEVLNLFAWIMAGIFIFFQFRTRTVVLGAFVSPVVLLMMIYASRGIGSVAAMPAVLKGNLVPVHVLLSVTGEALFALASCAGAMYLLQDHFLKRKKARRVSSILPSLGDLDRINHLCLLWGFPLLTLGVLMGGLLGSSGLGKLLAVGSETDLDPGRLGDLCRTASPAPGHRLEGAQTRRVFAVGLSLFPDGLSCGKEPLPDDPPVCLKSWAFFLSA